MTGQARPEPTAGLAAPPAAADHWHLQDALTLAQRQGVDPARGPSNLLAAADALAARGLRVLALASCAHAVLPPAGGVDLVESGLCLIGLVGLIDPPREEACGTVRDCLLAGITPVMITGEFV